QAEDGIRYFHVTGVQTCALPISPFDKAFADAVANLKQYTQFNVADLDLSEIDVIDPRLDMGRTSKWDFNDKDATQMAEYYKKEEIGRASCRKRGKRKRVDK